jgi:hypothetical protein
LNSKASRNQNNLLLKNKNYNNKSFDNNNIYNNNYNNNNNNRRSSHFYPNQTSHDYDKSNVISTISKSNERNLNYNISQENEYGSKYPPTYAQPRNKYNPKYQNNSFINDNSDLSDYSKIDKQKGKDKGKKAYHSIDNYNYNSKKKKKSYSEIDNSYVKSSDRLKDRIHKHMHKHKNNKNSIHNSSLKSSFKEKPITIAKQFKQSKNKHPKVKTKGVKKNRSVEKLGSNHNNNSILRNDYKISNEPNINVFNEDRLESETNNHFSYINKNISNNDINSNTSITKKNSEKNKTPSSIEKGKVVVKAKKFKSQEKINTNIDTNSNNVDDKI